MINRSFCFSSPIKFQVMHCEGGSGLWKEDVDWLPHLFVAGVVGAAIWQQEKELCLYVSFLCWNVGSIEEILCLRNDTILARKTPTVTSGKSSECFHLSCSVLEYLVACMRQKITSNFWSTLKLSWRRQDDCFLQFKRVGKVSKKGY